MDLEKYYTILEISKDASVEEIKIAFRNKAKIFHPDINKGKNAHEDFILLAEAYEYLTKLKTARASDFKFNKSKSPFSDNENYKKTNDEARKKAEKYAKMRYQEFMDSEYYQPITSIKTVLDHLFIFIFFIIFVIIPIITTYVFGLIAFFISTSVILLTSPVWINIGIQKNIFSVKKLTNSILFITQTKGFRNILFCIFNIFLVFKIGFQTLIYPSVFFLSFVIPILLSYFLTTYYLKTKKWSISLFIVPFFINILYLSNYTFSNRPSIETYFFDNSVQNTTYIYLNDYRYEEFPSILIFGNYRKMIGKRRITYTFETGLFGIRVLKDYYFHW